MAKTEKFTQSPSADVRQKFSKFKTKILDKMPDRLKPGKKLPSIMWRNSLLSHQVAVQVLYSDMVSAEYTKMIEQTIGQLTAASGNQEAWQKAAVEEVVIEFRNKKIIKSGEKTLRLELQEVAETVGVGLNSERYRKIDNMVLAEFLDQLERVEINPEGKCYGTKINKSKAKDSKAFVRRILSANGNTSISNAFENNVRDLRNLRSVLISIFQDYGEDYLQKTYEISFKEIRAYLIAIEMQLKIDSALNPEQRTLGMMHQFKSRTTPEYLANLRLAHEDMQRTVRVLSSETDARTDKKFDGMRYFRGWEFGTAGVVSIEEQQITSAFSRVDLVRNVETYENINKDINKLKTEYKISDRDVAIIIREILKCRDIKNIIEDASLFTHDKRVQLARLTSADKILLTDITLLLFGTEVRRNPRALIHNKMIIDMIIEGRMTWQNALDDHDRQFDLPIYEESKDEKNSWYKAKKQTCLSGGGVSPMSIKSVHQYAKVVNFNDGTKGYDARSKQVVANGEPVRAARTLNALFSGVTGHYQEYAGDRCSVMAVEDQTRLSELVHREGAVVNEYVAPKKWQPLSDKAVQIARLEAVKKELSSDHSARAATILDRTEARLHKLREDQVVEKTESIVRKCAMSLLE